MSDCKHFVALSEDGPYCAVGYMHSCFGCEDYSPWVATTQVCKVCGTPGCIENRGKDFHTGDSFGSKKCDYTGTPPFADAEWANDVDHLCLWCAGTGHPYGDESYGMCKCPGMGLTNNR